MAAPNIPPTPEPMFKTEHRGFASYRYRSDDGGKTWRFLYSSSHEQQMRQDTLAQIQVEAQRLK